MNSAPNPGRQLVVVAGSGRSGTSLFTGLSSRLGLYVPKPEVKANKTNPRGFSEPRWAVDFNEALLKRVSVTIDDARPEAWDITAELADNDPVCGELADWLEAQFAESDRVIVKDPRLAWFLELYRAAASRVGATVKVASMLRDPAEVLKSREIAYGDRLGPVTRAAGWMNVMLGSELLTRESSRAVIRYEDLLDDWRATMQRADDALELGLFSRASDEEFAHADALVDTSLRRSVSSLDELGIQGGLADLAQRIHDALARLAAEAGAESTAARADIDALREEYAAMHRDAVAVAQSSIGAVRRQARTNTANRVRRQIADEQAEQDAARPSLRSRASRMLRGAGS